MSKHVHKQKYLYFHSYDLILVFKIKSIFLEAYTHSTEILFELQLDCMIFISIKTTGRKIIYMA